MFEIERILADGTATWTLRNTTRHPGLWSLTRGDLRELLDLTRDAVFNDLEQSMREQWATLAAYLHESGNCEMCEHD